MDMDLEMDMEMDMEMDLEMDLEMDMVITGAAMQGFAGRVPVVPPPHVA